MMMDVLVQSFTQINDDDDDDTSRFDVTAPHHQYLLLYNMDA